MQALVKCVMKRRKSRKTIKFLLEGARICIGLYQNFKRLAGQILMNSMQLHGYN